MSVDSGGASLRDRKKARCKDEIVAAAIHLFEEKGINATTMADIAEASRVSVPTIFNYFGSKDGLLVAIVEEGTRKERESETRLPRVEGVPLAEVIQNLFSRIASQTLGIASKRVWRHTEASVIRHPDTELSRVYRNISLMLIESIADALNGYDLRARSGDSVDIHMFARVLHDLWMPCFVQLITEAKMTLEEHDALFVQRFAPLLPLIFEDDCLEACVLRRGEET